MSDSSHRNPHDEILVPLLRGLRVSRQLRQEDLAERVQRDQVMVSRVEAGERHLDYCELRMWVQALDTDFLDFVAVMEDCLNGAPLPKLPLRSVARPRQPPEEDT